MKPAPEPSLRRPTRPATIVVGNRTTALLFVPYLSTYLSLFSITWTGQFTKIHVARNNRLLTRTVSVVKFLLLLNTKLTSRKNSSLKPKTTYQHRGSAPTIPSFDYTRRVFSGVWVALHIVLGSERTILPAAKIRRCYKYTNKPEITDPLSCWKACTWISIYGATRGRGCQGG